MSIGIITAAKVVLPSTSTITHNLSMRKELSLGFGTQPVSWYDQFAKLILRGGFLFIENTAAGFHDITILFSC
jgi:hypothetical protein